MGGRSKSLREFAFISVLLATRQAQARQGAAAAFRISVTDARAAPVNLDLVINGRFLGQQMTGVQRVACEITRAIDRLLVEGRLPGVRVRLVAPSDADPAPLALSAIGLERVGRGSSHFWEQFVLPRHIGSATLLCLGNSAPFGALLGRRRPAVMLHDQAYLLFPEDYSIGYRLFHRLMDTLLLSSARPLFMVSDAERRVIDARNPRRKAPLLVAPNGSWINDEPVDRGTLPSQRSDPGYALYVGSFTQRKNVAGLLAAAIALAGRRGVASRFVGPPSALSRSIAEGVPLRLRPLITFTGYVTNEELGDLYRGAACLLYPSFYEASGLPPSEAMSFGCPVVVSDLPVMRERCGDAAIYCDPNDPESIVAAVLQIVDDKSFADVLAARGLARAAEFTWRNQAIRILGALGEGAA